MELREYVYWLAIGLSGLTTVLYLVIGLNLVSLGEIAADEQRVFGLSAAAAFAAGTAAALLWDRRWLWVGAAIALGVIIIMYFSLASQRVPRFETWGVLIRVVQFPLLASLVYLAVTTPQS